MNHINEDTPDIPVDQVKSTKLPWELPKLTSYDPVANTQGISYRPLDGISNLT